MKSIGVCGAVLILICNPGCQGPNRDVPDAEAYPRRLNNFVTELLKVEELSGEHNQLELSNPREGWIHISARANGAAKIVLDSESMTDGITIQSVGAGDSLAEMRYLPAGEYTLTVDREGRSSLEGLAVRSIPQLLFCEYDTTPYLSKFGKFDHDFLAEHILENVNTLCVGGRREIPRPVTEAWQQQGKRWYGICGIPRMGEDTTADYYHDYWMGFLGGDSFLDGIIVDEFGPVPKFRRGRTHFSLEQYAQWTEAVTRICRDTRGADKEIQAWVYGGLGSAGGMWDQPVSRSFMKTLTDCDNKIAWERYLSEQPTLELAREALDNQLKEPMLAWEKAQPGISEHVAICLGLRVTPPSLWAYNPQVDHKVWFDMQVNMIANDPAFSEIGGLMWWTSLFADEETIRWIGQLFRHYCIEGNSGLLSEDPYLLEHIENPDFHEGVRGWTVVPAEEGSAEKRTYQDYGKLQGRRTSSSDGDTFLWMKRSAEGPNAFSQEIRGLEVGRHYSMKMYTTDYRGLVQGNSEEQNEHAVNIRIEGAAIDSSRSFQQGFVSNPWPPNRASSEGAMIWINLHRLIFRAESKTAFLTVSDWQNDREGGGKIGEELVYNWIEIQPYLDE